MLSLLHLVLLLFLTIVAHSSSSSPPCSGKLKFKVSGRLLPTKTTAALGKGNTYAYFELFVSTDQGKTKTKVERSDSVSKIESPDWETVFEFDFDRAKDQWWQFYVWNEDKDNPGEDSKVGRVWVNVADYLDKGQVTYAKLDRDKGYLVIKSVDPLGQLPMPEGAPDAEALKFRVSASGLPSKDDAGFVPGNKSSDPYVVISVVEGFYGVLSPKIAVGKSTILINNSSSSNPAWGDVFSVQWSRKKPQRLHVIIYDDDDTSRQDDKIGNGWLELNDYVAKGQNYTLVLPKKGTLTISKA